MKNLKVLFLILLVSFTTISCFEDNDDNLITASEINDFVWKGMNVFYLYKENIPNLANDRFATNEEYGNYLNSFSSPEDLFESLIYQRETVDRFSWIVDDYIALEQFFDGISVSNGMEYQVFRFSDTDTNRYGVVTHVLPNTSAENQGVERGDIFYGINGSQLYYNSENDNNYDLFNLNSYEINLGTYNNNGTPETTDDSVITTSENISLSKAQYEENPILINNVLDINGTKIAYLMYNGFTGTDAFNTQLNNVFGSFKSNSATELVLDLRYNSGGSVYTALLLSSLITGQFTNDVFSTEEWNSEFQEAFQNEDPELLINRFVDNDDGTPLNSLNLSKVYILTSGRSASASELVINSLDPYIDVIQIGTTTSGKYQASTTLYDSDNFRREGANQSHTYAMQPLIYKSLNVNGVTDYFNGLSPNAENVLQESVNNLGVLGDANEPLLARAISLITGTGKNFNKSENYNSVKFTDGSNDFKPFQKGLYDEKELPDYIINKIFFE